VKDDAKDWLEILEAIERQMEGKRPLGPQEIREIRRIKEMSSTLKTMIRN
jgi:hypothetical protein